MYRLVTGEVTEATPTLGFNVETITYKDNEFTIWDMGGQENIRRLWRHYFLRIRGRTYTHINCPLSVDTFRNIEI